jgi:tetratricopeptide (TPR) repeat protein
MTSDAKDKAVIHNNLAQAYRQIGQIDKAILHWEQAIQIYRADDNKAQRRLSQLLTEQAQAYSTQGQHQRAVQLAQSAIELARQIQDQATVAAALGVLGNANWALGNYDPAIASHQASLKIAETLKTHRYIITALGNLGNVLTSRLKRYQYQANVAELDGDEQEEARLTKLVTQDRVAAQGAYELCVLESKTLGGMAEARALLNLNRLLAQSPARAADAIDRNRNRVLVYRPA